MEQQQQQQQQLYEEEEDEALDDGDEENIDVCQGQTDAERREIRKSQRVLLKDIPDLKVREARNLNNKIFRNVRYVRESVLDAENLDEIAKKAANNVDQLIQIPRYDADRVVKKLLQKCRITSGGSSKFDWEGLGEQAGVCFNAIPSRVSFLNGPLLDGNEEVRVKQRAKRKPKTQPDSDNEEERPETVKGHTARDKNQLSAVQKNIEEVEKALKKKVEKNYSAVKRKLIQAYGSDDQIPKKLVRRLKKNREVNGVNLLFNPKSFTQTVENLYHFSFLVKEGTAVFKVRDSKLLDEEKGVELEGGPVVRNVEFKEKKNAPPPPRQAIVNLTMEDWKNLCEAYEVKASGVPHRK
mmetsp:Transcript_7167/g.18006  ORF Transcript_7167/g.18006 Transcript_7167/m.18006 type:complete len:353 (+) Transcript_7167:226-1284(+)